MNYGILTANNYNIAYSVNGILTDSQTVNIPLALGQSTVNSFNQTLDFSLLGNYVLTAEVTIVNDQDTVNNVLSKTISVVSKVDSLLFNQGSSWRFLDSGINPGSSWKDSLFNDSIWPVGIGHFGFGEGDEHTRLKIC